MWTYRLKRAPNKSRLVIKVCNVKCTCLSCWIMPLGPVAAHLIKMYSQNNLLYNCLQFIICNNTIIIIVIYLVCVQIQNRVLQYWHVIYANPEISITLVCSTKPQMDFSINFWCIGENKLCDQQKYDSCAFCMIIFTKDHNIYEYWSLNIISRNKKLKQGHKQTTPVSHDFNITTINLLTAVFIYIYIKIPNSLK